MKLLYSKMNHYCKQISITHIKELLKYSKPPSKLAFRASRCLCLLLTAFYHYPQQKDCLFKTWSEILAFLNNKYPNLISDLENLRGKCELAKPYFNSYLIDVLKREVLLTKDNESDLDDNSASPRVKNLIYKPIFCYTFFLLSYLNLKMSLGPHSLSITRNLSKSPSDISVIDLNRSNQTITPKQRKSKSLPKLKKNPLTPSALIEKRFQML